MITLLKDKIDSDIRKYLKEQSGLEGLRFRDIIATKIRGFRDDPNFNLIKLCLLNDIRIKLGRDPIQRPEDFWTEDFWR